MRKLIVILFIALIDALVLFGIGYSWGESSVPVGTEAGASSAGVGLKAWPDTEVYTKEMWHQKFCIQPRYKNLPECQENPTETAIDVSGIIVQM